MRREKRCRDSEGKKMRFSRLGLNHEVIETLDMQGDRLKELENIRDRTENERDIDLDQGD